MDLKAITEACRICEKVDDIDSLFYLLEDDLKVKFEAICGITVWDEDEFTFLCGDCKATIESSYKLRQLAQNKNQNVVTVKQEDFKTKEIKQGSSSIDDKFLDDPLKQISQEYDVIKVVDDVEEYLEDQKPNTSTQKNLTDEKLKDFTQCFECLKHVKTIYLDDHLKKCNGKKAKHECSYDNCGKRYVKAQSLQIHITARHLGQKLFQCDICKKNYSTKDILVIYLKYLISSFILMKLYFPEMPHLDSCR